MYHSPQYLNELSRRSSLGGAGVGGAAAEEGATAAGGAAHAAASTAGSTPAQLQRLRKRKLRGCDSALHKRRSSVGDAVLLSLSGNLLDCTPSPDGKQLLEGMRPCSTRAAFPPEMSGDVLVINRQ